jgi:hypothetical protein
VLEGRNRSCGVAAISTRALASRAAAAIN